MDAKDLLESRRYLSHIRAWPTPPRLDVDGWLTNFDDGEDRTLAREILESHVHIDEEQVTYSVASAVRSISGRAEFGPRGDRADNWKLFIDAAIVSFPQGSAEDATGSGYIFARIAERIGFPKTRIAGSERLVARLANGPACDVIFIDDIAATGTQFARNWDRKYNTPSGRLSLRDIQTAGNLRSIYYVPVVATLAAVRNIVDATGIAVVPAYELEPDYGVWAQNTRLVSPGSVPRLRGFLEKYSPRTGHDEYGVAGYGNLGLSVSFHHGCPNNSLPVLHWAPSDTEWKHLVSS